MECAREQIAHNLYPATLSFKSGRGCPDYQGIKIGADRQEWEERGCLKAGLCTKLCVPHWNDLVSLFLRHLVQCLTHTVHNDWHRKSWTMSCSSPQSQYQRCSYQHSLVPKYKAPAPLMLFLLLPEIPDLWSSLHSNPTWHDQSCSETVLMQSNSEPLTHTQISPCHP